MNSRRGEHRTSLIALVEGRSPGIIRFLRRGFHFVSALVGTRAQELRWTRRSPAEVAEGFGNLNQPYRRLILEHISQLDAWDSLLEVGSGYGPNLYHLAKRFPGAVLRGLDINPLSVTMGNEWFRASHVDIRLSPGRADDLHEFRDHEFDVVLTYGLLLYIGSDKIERTITEMLRVARRYLVFVEHQWNQDDTGGSGRYQSGNWMRDYGALLRRLTPESRVEVAKAPAALWDDEAWKKYGAIITCDKHGGGERREAASSHVPLGGSNA